MLYLEPTLRNNLNNNSPYLYFLKARIPQWDAYKEEVTRFSIDTFKKNYNPQLGYNVELKSSLVSTIYNDFLNICGLNFDNVIIHQKNKQTMWAYVQNCEIGNSIWHNHKNSTTINAVWYPSVPDKTGTLSIRDGAGETEIEVEEGYIYFWPYWMDHKPNLQKHSKDWRVSINIELLTTTRPMVKINNQKTNVMW